MRILSSGWQSGYNVSYEGKTGSYAVFADY